MQGQTLDLQQIIIQDDIAKELINVYMDWDSRRGTWLAEKAEIQRYIWATDTTKTSNSQLPWKNKTTLPKLCQIRDNLYANYVSALFPKRKWLNWEADTEKDQKKEKAATIEAYSSSIIDYPGFQTEVSKMLYDYIDYGNVFATVEWVDESQVNEETNTEKSGYVGPVPKRIAPVDILFNPIAPSFYKTGKFIRSLYTMGDFASKVEQETSDDRVDAMKTLLEYMADIRHQVGQYTGKFDIKNEILNVSGFSSYIDYLRSNYVEVISFIGDYYDVTSKTLYRNKIITIVDRCRLLHIQDIQGELAGHGIWHVGWRPRQETLWAMGPLDNLVGMQYRIDHLENLKADVFDLVAAPPLKIKGMVEDFTWGPFSRIHVGDDGDVEVLAPDVNALSANLEIMNLQNQMEEMAGSPKEAMGFRTPGEKTMYEVQRLENAAARIFATKIKQFEVQILEPMLNAMLEMARRKLNATTIRIFDSELNATMFQQITKDDLIGSGRIKPMAARNFAERAEIVQNLNNFFASTLGADPAVKVHFSTIKLAKMFEDILDIESYGVVSPYIRITEEQEAQQLNNAATEQTQMEAQTPAGTVPGDMPSPMGMPA